MYEITEKNVCSDLINVVRSLASSLHLAYTFGNHLNPHPIQAHRVEPLLVDTQEYALYVANLIHKDSQAVIKVVHDEKTLASFPDEQTIKQVEQQSARQ